MVDKPMDLIEKYLERVKVYLPLGNEDILAEIRTHLIEEAELLGQGQVTHGSAMLAIERFGDPKDAAHEWAGTGKRLGPVPVEYATPVVKIALTLIALGTIFIAGASIINYAMPGIWEVANIPLSILAMVLMSLFYAFLIIGGISYLDGRGKPPSEKTMLESILGVGGSAFKPKPRSEAAGGFFFGIVFAMVVMSPPIQQILTTEALLFVTPFAVLLLVEAIVNLLFVMHGENNVNLLLEAVVAAIWVVFAMFLINLPFPLEGFYSFSDATGWEYMSFEEFYQLVPEFQMFPTLNMIWVFVVIIIAITNLWTALVASMKIPMYLQAGKGWWWKGEWGSKRWKRYRGRSIKDHERPIGAN